MIRRILESIRGEGVASFQTAATATPEAKIDPPLFMPAGVWMHHMTPTQMTLRDNALFAANELK